MVRVRIVFNVRESYDINKVLHELERNNGFRLIDIKFTASLDSFANKDYDYIRNDALIIFEMDWNRSRWGRLVT